MQSSYGSRDWAARSTVAAVFFEKEQAEAAIRELKDKGFDKDQIGVAIRDRDEQGRIIEETGTHAAAGAATGAVGAGVLGGVAGYLVGIGLLAIPGVGPVVAAGVLTSTLGVAGATAAVGAGVGAVAGGIVGALIGVGIPKHEAEHFETGLREGRALVTVTAPGRAGEAAGILEDNGGDTGASLYDPVRRSA